MNDKNNVDKSSVSVEEEQVVLNERQKSILQEMGLSTDYEKLDAPQQKSIIAIEELLTHLENRYNLSFSYVGYYPLEILQDEKLTAVPEWGDPNHDLVEVIRPRDGSPITDNYPPVAARPIYQEALNQALVELENRGLAKAYVVTFSYGAQEAPKDFDELMASGFGASQNVFVKKSSVDSLASYAQALQAWIEEMNIPGRTRLFLLSDEDFDNVNQDNFPDFQIHEHPLEKADFTVESK